MTDNLLLIAATTILVLTAQRYFQTPAPLSNTACGTGCPALNLGARARRSTDAAGTRPSPWRIPWAGWKDILWRTYERTNDDRLLATAAGVVFFGLLAVFPAVTALVSSYGCSPMPRPSAPICRRWR